jgi:putative transposase
MKTSRYTEAQIIAILRRAGGGVPVAELCREHGMSNASFYKWRAKYGGMDASLISQMKAIEDENRRLKRIYADLSMQADLLKEALGKSDRAISTPRDGRECGCATWGGHCAGLPGLLGQRDLLSLWPEVAGRERGDRRSAGRGLTDARKTWGFGLCFLHLRNVKGHPWNHKRVYRIYCALELNLRIKPRKRLRAG